MSPSPAIPMFITVPPLPSNPGTPGEMPGTPTSTTTSLSTLSTTAIKDGHRGHAHLALGGPKGHGHHPSTNSLEAERADRISRLAGLERVSTIRAPNPPPPQDPNNDSPYVTPTSASFPILNLPPPLVPAYFDANGQPTAITKVSTVGTASATGSVSARTTTESGERFESDLTDIDEDGLSTDTNYRAMDVDSTSGAIDPMDEDLTNRSVSGFDDRMSDDGNASLVGFGEGANSTVSGPIYTRKQHLGNGMLGMERSNSGLSQDGLLKVRDMRDIAASDTPVSPSAMAEAQDARYVDGIAVDGGGGHVGTADDDVFVDTTTRGPLPVQPGQPQTGALREGVGGPANRELVERMVRERMVRERLGRSQGQGQGAAPSNPEGGEKNNKLHEDKK